MLSKKYQYAILFCLAAIGIWYSYSHAEMFLKLKRISLTSLLVLVLLFLVFQLANGAKFKYLASVFGTELNFKEWFGLTACNTMFNYYLPARGGTIARAFYLKKNRGFKYAHYGSLMMGSYVIFFLLSASAGLVFTFLYYPTQGKELNPLLLIFGSLLLLTIIGTLLVRILLKHGSKIKHEKIHQILLDLNQGLNFFLEELKSDERHLILKLSLVHLLGIVVMGARLFVVFHALEVEVHPLQMLIIPSLTTFSMILSLTPANLGIREGVISFSATLLGLEADTAMLVAIIDRAVVIIITFTLGLIFSHSLLKNFDAKAASNEVDY